MPTTGQVTANEINVTVQAHQDFEDAYNQFNSINSLVNEAQQTLHSSYMVSQAGSQFGLAVQQWCDDFTDIGKTLNWMSQQLLNTATQLKAGDQQNTDIAAHLPAFGQNF